MTPAFPNLRRWVPLAAACALAAVLVVVVVLVRGGTSTDGRSPTATSDAGQAAEGWRLVSYRDVVVEVPETWDHDFAPGSDWCASDGNQFAKEPYVDSSGPYDATLSIGCMGEMPSRFEVTHLTFDSPEAEADPLDRTRSDWRPLSRRVGAVLVIVWTDPQHEDVAQKVIDSARTVEVDQNGCDVSSAIQAGHFARPPDPFRIEDVATVDAISVCQYEIGAGTDVPGLLASRRISGPAAEQVLAAVHAAPVGGGPDAPSQCSEDVYGDTALVLRWHSGDTVRDMFVYMESCRGNGFDDGTSVRELTPEACRPLWALPVRLISGHSESFARCHD